MRNTNVRLRHKIKTTFNIYAKLLKKANVVRLNLYHLKLLDDIKTYLSKF